VPAEFLRALGLSAAVATIFDHRHPSFLIEDVMGEVVNRAIRLMNEAHENDFWIALCDETKKYA